MAKKLVRLTEGELHRIIKESVNNILNEGEDPYLDELSKKINYYHSEAMQNLQGLLKAYNELPKEYSNMKFSNISMVRNAIKALEMAYGGNEWRDIPM